MTQRAAYKSVYFILQGTPGERSMCLSY